MQSCIFLINCQFILTPPSRDLVFTFICQPELLPNINLLVSYSILFIKDILVSNYYLVLVVPLMYLYVSLICNYNFVY